MSEENIIYGLIGNPLKHSLSPIIHNTAFEELGIDAEYKLFPLEEDEVGDFLKRLKQKDCNIFGLNVTVPYKETVISYLDSLSPFAQKAKAVNTIVVNEDKTLHGCNTDGPGFLAHLMELQWKTADQSVVILGAGGASRAIISALCLLPRRPRAIRIYDIEKEKAEYLISDLKERIDLSIVKTVHSIDELDIPGADLLINATPIGMKEDDPCLVEPELFHSGMSVYDLVYNPSKTLLLKIAEGQGAQIANGLGMLLYQAFLAFGHWADQDLNESIKEKIKEKLMLV